MLTKGSITYSININKLSESSIYVEQKRCSCCIINLYAAQKSKLKLQRRFYFSTLLCNMRRCSCCDNRRRTAFGFSCGYIWRFTKLLRIWCQLFFFCLLFVYKIQKCVITNTVSKYFVLFRQHILWVWVVIN